MKYNPDQARENLRNLELREAKELLAENYIENIKALESSDRPLTTLKEILKHGQSYEMSSSPASGHEVKAKHELDIDLYHSPKHIQPDLMAREFNHKNKLPEIENPNLSQADYQDIFVKQRRPLIIAEPSREDLHKMENISSSHALMPEDWLDIEADNIDLQTVQAGYTDSLSMDFEEGMDMDF